MPEVGLGIGRGRQTIGGIEQEVLIWHDAQGTAYPMPDEVIREMQAQLKAEQQRAERMAEYLRTDKSALALSLGLDPNNLPEP